MRTLGPAIAIGTHFTAQLVSMLRRVESRAEVHAAELLAFGEFSQRELV